MDIKVGTVFGLSINNRLSFSSLSAPLPFPLRMYGGGGFARVVEIQTSVSETFQVFLPLLVPQMYTEQNSLVPCLNCLFVSVYTVRGLTGGDYSVDTRR